MSQFVFANNVSTTLAAPVTSTTQTTIHLSSSANFPTIPSGSYWAVTLNDQATGLIYEILYCTSYSGNILTVLRGREGTTPQTWLTGDFAFAAVTAAELEGFIQGQLGGPYVQLSPSVQQNGFINISGAVNAGSGVFSSGASIGGPLTNATTGAFTGQVTANNLVTNSSSRSSTFANLNLTMVGSGGVTIGIGPTTQYGVWGITSTALAIGAVGSNDFVAIDQNGNLAVTKALYSYALVVNGTAQAATVEQSGKVVIDTLKSSDGSVLVSNTSPGTWNLEVAPVTQLPSGSSLMAIGNNSNPTIALPGYGTWKLLMTYGLIQGNNSNYSVNCAVASGTVTGFASNANGSESFNAVKTITVVAVGQATGGQTVSFSVTAGGGGTFNATQPWSIIAVRN